MSRIPNVPERVKEAPAHALRAMFAGIGQALLLSDRMRRKLKSQHDGGEGNGHRVVRIPVRTGAAVKQAAGRDAGAEAKPAAAAPATSSAAPVTEVVPAAEAPPAPPAEAPTPPPADKTPAPPPADKTPAPPPAAEALPGAEAPTAPPAAAPPIPNYDELSVASLRARLRGLDRTQVGQLLSYEKARGSRAEVIAMYERRIEKLGQADG